MLHTISRSLQALGCCLLACWCLLAAEPQAKLDHSDYRTVETAVTKQVGKVRPGQAGQTGYLGVSLARDDHGQLVVEDVQPESPAAKAGVKKGDVVTRVGEHAVRTPEAFRGWLQTHPPGET